MIYERMRVPSNPRGGALPTYQRQSTNYVPGSGVSARIDDSAARIAGAGGDAEARALAGLGKAVKGAVDVGVRAYDDYSKSKATQLLTEYRRTMNQALYGDGGILTKQGEAAIDADQQRGTLARKLRGELLKQTNESTQYYFNHFADEYDADTSLKAQKYGSEQRIVMLNRNDEAASQERAEFAMGRYVNQQDFDRGVGEALWHAEQLMRRKGYSGEALGRGLKEFSSKIFAGSIQQALANGDIQSAERLLSKGSRIYGDGESAYSRMTAPDIADAKLRIQAKREALQAKAEANRNKAVREILKGERDALYLAERGNVFALEDMTKRLRAAGATEEAEALETQTTAFRESAQVLRSAAELPLPEAMGKLREMDAELDTTLNIQDVDRHRILSSSRDMLARQLSARTNALQKDPAAAAESAAQFQPRQFQLPDDASMEDRAAARMSWQVKNGVSSPVPLTKQEVENLAEQYEKASSPGDFVAMLSESFGGQSGEVLKQLVTSGKLPPDANLALNMPRESANLLMMMNRKDAVKEAEHALGVDKPMTDDISEAVRDELEDILGTLMAQGGSRAAAQVLDSSYKLSLKYMERGMDAKDAGARAAREVMAERYEVRDSYRVPRDYDADNVASGAKLWLDELASSGIVAINAVPGLTEAQTKTKKAEIVRSSGRWVNNADESGLLLTMNGAPILNVDGRLIQVKFEDLAAKGERRKEANALSGPARGGSSRTILVKNK